MLNVVEQIERAADPEQEARERAAASLAWARGKLTGQARPSSAYPADALGPLSDACRALASGAQVRHAMAGQSLLAVGALLTQHLSNVRTIEAVKPLSLYCLTIGESGDGKSTADTVAQTAVQEKQRRETRAYDAQVEEIESTPKGQRSDAKPPEPYRIASQGVFSSEAAAMLAGYGMSPDNRAKSAATFNGMWDDGEISVSRGTTGRQQLYDRRLSIHWLIQPEAAREAMGDSLLSTIGFWPRFMLAWPEPSAPRIARPWRADKDGHIGDYWRTCTRLMETSVGKDCSDLPAIECTDEAMSLACRFFERMEQEAKGAKGQLTEIKPFAVRATEQAFRVAGVLALFGGAKEIDAGAMRDSIKLASYSLETWRGVFGDRDVIEASAHALTLYRWILAQPDERASEQSILHIGPKRLRSASRRDTALATLEQYNIAYREAGYWYARHYDEVGR